jgi:hypothetical protein
MPYRLITLAVEALIAGCALALALLGGYLLLGDGLTALAGLVGMTPPSVAWPGPFTAAARLLLWPVTRPFGQEPALAGPGAILAAMALYVALTVGVVAVINLLTRPPRKA